MRPARPLLAVIALAIALALPQTAPASTRTHAVSTFIGYVNAARAQRGLAQLRPTGALLRSSQGYSGYLMRRDYFGHSGLARAGRFRLLGEVLEKHSGSRRRPRLAFRLLMGSPVHRRVLMDPRMRSIGAGVTRGRFRGARAVIWVVHVGRR